MTIPQRRLATCLVVDDHPLMCQAIRVLLEPQEQLTVVGEARCGEHALELLRSLKPDVALIDVMLTTGIDGFETTHLARAEQLPTRVVMYSAHDRGEYVRRAFDSGAYGYVTKMSPYEHLVSSLHAVAQGNRYVDPQISAELLDPSSATLSARERQVLELLSRGMQNDGIAFDLGLSTETVKTHVSKLMGKLDATSRAGAVAQAFRTGLIA